MSSDSSTKYDGTVLYDDDDEFKSGSDSQSSNTEAETTHRLHPEQPIFISLTSTPGILDSFFSIGVSSQISQRSRFWRC